MATIIENIFNIKTIHGFILMAPFLTEKWKNKRLR